MGPTVALLSFFVVLATGQPAGQKPCCESKEVGGVKYMLTGTMDTKAYGCITNCLYETKAKPDMKFCFAPGDLEVECLDDGSSKPPKGDSTKPPKEENSKPPMDGSSKPPMEGSSKPPMDKTSKPPMEETSKPPMDGSSKSPMDGSTKPPMGSSSEKPGSDDEVVTRVKGYIDAGTCGAVTFSDYSDSECGDNAVSYYKEFIYNNKRIIISNNIPDHPAENDQLQENPNKRCP